MLQALQQEVTPFLAARRWLIAFSGGMDSTVLLHAVQQTLQQLPADNKPELIALHVHHGMQAAADEWQQHCADMAASMGVQFVAERITLAANGSRELAAREARYRVFARHVQEGDCLLLAHHQDDQAETMLYRLCRGAGLHGLGAMRSRRPFGRGWLLRPLLACQRQALASYAAQHELHWVDDPSNCEEHHDRNFLRRQIMPLLQSRWPQAVASMARAARHLQQAQSLLDELAELDLLAAGHGNDGEAWLGIAGLSRLSPARQNNLLRYWLRQQQLPLSEKQLHTLLSTVIESQPSAMPALRIGGWVLRRYRQRLYLCAAQPEPLLPCDWHTGGVLHLPDGCCYRLSEPRNMVLQVRPRCGGEKIRLPGSRHSRLLKTLLQERQQPAWRRDRLPLFYYQGELLAAGEWLSEQGEAVLRGARIVRCAPGD